ncbi:unnamed protein product [Penicillium egyptiacum]|uniref:Ankyrin n=1 Tax=Penicillium egyptiacum TaxID=1303716 RepID=A0A9W4K8J3_9EURO|nr:unnamed protein product [Penicillium egyptiacum]
MKSAIAASAIQRGDCHQLRASLINGSKIADCSNRLAIIPLDIAAKKGYKAIIELFIANGCPMRYHCYDASYWEDDIKVTDMMAESANFSGLDAWIDHLAKEGDMIPKILKRAMTRAGRYGHMNVMELVQGECEAMYGSPVWLAHALEWAISYGSLDAIKLLFRRSGVDTTTRKSPPDRMPLLKVIYRCPIGKRPDIVRFLLENGADPNGNDPPKKSTPFEVAIKAKDFESASILFKHGAVVTSKE